MITQFFIYTIKDLRNAIAHNNVIFDTRFKTGNINNRLILLLEKELNIQNMDFKYIDAYVIMITYFLKKMGKSKKECKSFVISYHQQTEYLREKIPVNIYYQVVRTQHKSNIKALLDFIQKS